MKKIFIVAIATLFLFFLSACGSSTEVTETTTTTETTTEATTETTTETTTEKTHEPTIDFVALYEEAEVLHDYNQNYESDRETWLVDDMLYTSGKFYFKEDELFDLSELDEDIDIAEVRLLGCSTTPYGTNYIAVKSCNKIWLVKENKHTFTFGLIADDAVKAPSKMMYPMRSDRFFSFYSNDAVQYERSVFYRSVNGGIVQLDLFNNEINGRRHNSENPVLICDYTGVWWLQIEDFGEIEYLPTLLEKTTNDGCHPETYVTRDGTSTAFVFNYAG